MLDENLRGTNALVVETFDENCHVFNLVEKGNAFFLQLENMPIAIQRLIIKPQLLAFFVDEGIEYGSYLLKPLNFYVKKNLARNYYIDPMIFHTLVNYKLISYSKAMADLYELPAAYSRDIKYHHNDYKRTCNKQQVLQKLRQGHFN